jgi:hypothetical protein
VGIVPSGLKKTRVENKDDAKVQADKALSGLKDQRAKVSERLKEVKQKSVDVWHGFKAGTSTAMDECKKGYENVKAKFE